MYLKNKQIHKIFFPFIFGFHWTTQSFIYNYRKKRIWDYSEILKTNDGDVFRLDVMDPNILNNEKKVIKREGNINDRNESDKTINNRCNGNIVIIHGFNGSSESKYVVNLAFHLKKMNYRAFGYNYRGAKTEMLTKNHIHIGFTDDISIAIEYIKKNYNEKIGIVGFSMGGILTTNFFASIGQFDAAIKFGICISMPLNLLKTYNLLIKPLYKYTVHNYVLKNALLLLKRNRALLDDMKFDNIRDLDYHLLNSRYNDFDIDTYYSQNSPINTIPMIKKPFVVLISEDDVCAPVFAEDKEIFRNSNSILILTKVGGHLGFVRKTFYKTYAEAVVADFLNMFFND
ncbi:Protein ABHD1 [Dictyocoela muelleri]|nr:Protein ABHD1 [Dictyocoela muelleri]